MVFGVGLLPAARVGAGVVFRVLFMVVVRSVGRAVGSSHPCGKELLFAATAQGVKWTLGAVV